MMDRTLRFSTLDEAVAELHALARAGRMEVSGAWSWPQVLTHCAQSVECSISGFPEYKPAWFRKTVGRLVLRKFLRQGFMSHDRAAPVPGAPELPRDGDANEAMSRLLNAIDAFRAHGGPLAPHFAFGPLTKEEYEALHAMHLADHLSAVSGQ
jgi:hypothetical protein